MRAGIRMSSHGDISRGGPGRSHPGKIKLATIPCVQVVPVLPDVAMTMSSSRKVKKFQRKLSTPQC